MSYSIVTIAPFEKELKHLSKKFPSIKKDIANLVRELMHTPTLGTSLGNDCYKIRIAIASKSKGKSGGGRIITCVKVTQTTVFLVTIYDKSEKESISDKELNVLLQNLP